MTCLSPHSKLTTEPGLEPRALHLSPLQPWDSPLRADQGRRGGREGAGGEEQRGRKPGRLAGAQLDGSAQGAKASEGG